MATLSNEQFQQLLEAMNTSAVRAATQAVQGMEQRAAAPAQHASSAAVVGQVPPCNLGKNKLKRYRIWTEWIRDAENKMSFLSITENSAKISFIRSVAGPQLTELWDKEARIRFEDVPAIGNVAALNKHTYDEIKTVI